MNINPANNFSMIHLDAAFSQKKGDEPDLLPPPVVVTTDTEDGKKNLSMIFPKG